MYVLRVKLLRFVCAVYLINYYQGAQMLLRCTHMR